MCVVYMITFNIQLNSICFKLQICCILNSTSHTQVNSSLYYKALLLPCLERCLFLCTYCFLCFFFSLLLYQVLIQAHRFWLACHVCVIRFDYGPFFICIIMAAACLWCGIAILGGACSGSRVPIMIKWVLSLKSIAAS